MNKYMVHYTLLVGFAGLVGAGFTIYVDAVTGYLMTVLTLMVTGVYSILNELLLVREGRGE